MALARGAGKRIDGGGFSIRRPFTVVYALVQPLSGSGVTAPGGVDADGRYLHIRYKGNLELRSRSGGNQPNPSAIPPDFMPNMIDVEFDANSIMTFPFCGEVELIGGSGEWKFGFHELEPTDVHHYKPELRTLRTVVNRTTQFTIPDWHTYLWTMNPNASFLLPGGEVVYPGPTSPGMPITPGLVCTMGPTTNVVVTGWKG